MTQKTTVPGRRGLRELAGTRARPAARSLPALGFLLALCVLSYANAWQGEFVSDDVVLRVHLSEIAQAHHWTALVTRDFFQLESGAHSGFYRPLSSLVLLVDQALFGAHPLGYHLTNLVLHVLVTWLVLGLALRCGLAPLAALAAASLFAVHPVHVEAVAWISGQPDLLCAFFYLAALWLFTSAHAGHSRARYGLALAAGAAALLAKEMAVTLPAAILLADVYGVSRARGPRPAAPRGFWSDAREGVLLRVAPFVLVLVGYVVLRFQVLGLSLGQSALESAPLLERGLTFERAVLYYMRLLVWPGRLNAYPTIPPVTSPLSPWFLGGALVLAGLVVAALRFRRSWPEMAFGAAFLGLGLIPLSNAVGLYPVEFFRFFVAERYLYLPSFGFVVAGAALLWELSLRVRSRQRTAFAMVAGALCVLGAGRSLARNPVWRTTDALFEDTLRANPESAWAHLAIATLRREQARLPEAEAEVEAALRLQPRSYAVLLAQAQLRDQEGNWQAAVDGYERALAIRPKSRDARLGLAGALRQLGRLDEAAQHFAVVVSGNPRDTEAIVNQGELLLAQGKDEAARANFERAIVLNRYRKEAWFNLGRYHLKHGELEDAEQLALRTLGIDPGYREAYLLLGNVQVRKRDFADATRSFEKAVALDSTFVTARVNLAAACLEQGNYARAISELRTSLRQSPSSYAYVNLGQAQKRTGDSGAAESSFREAVRLDPKLTRAKLELGLLLAGQSGREAEARELLEALPASTPPDAEVQSVLERLRGKPRHQ